MLSFKWLFLVHGGKAKIMHIVCKTQRFHTKSIFQKKKKSSSSRNVSHFLLAAVSFVLMKFKFSFRAGRSSIGRNSKKEWSHIKNEWASFNLGTLDVSVRKKLN